jgi:hypothetical protein
MKPYREPQFSCLSCGAKFSTSTVSGYRCQRCVNHDQSAKSHMLERRARQERFEAMRRAVSGRR